MLTSSADSNQRATCRFCCVQAKCEWGLTPSQESLITSVVFVGTMSGAYAWGSLGDAKGRKLGFFGTALFTFAFGVLSALAPSYAVGVHSPCFQAVFLSQSAWSETPVVLHSRFDFVFLHIV